MFYCALNGCHLTGNRHLSYCVRTIDPVFDTAAADADAWRREDPTTDRNGNPKWAMTTLRVTFMDGEVIEYPETRYKATAQADVPDPIKIDGTTVEIENMEQSFTLLGVRSFTMEF